MSEQKTKQQYKVKQCYYCHGTGITIRNSNGPIQKCENCKGKGKIKVKVQRDECGACRGTGFAKDLTPALEACENCNGTGKITPNE